MRALLLHNLGSGQRDRREEVAGAVARLSGAGWQVEMAACAEIGQVEQRTRQAVAQGVEMVVVAGGDGTVNAAIQAMAYRSTILGVIPTGTANVWARDMRIPLDVRGATQVLLSGEVARVDLGQANGRYFLFVAGVGFDASVTRAMDHRAKRRLGILAYVIAGIVEAFKLRGEEVTIVSGNRPSRQRVLMVVASNTRLYGGLLTMAPQAFADDGLLDIWVFRGRGLLAAARHALNVLLGRHHQDPEVQSFQTPAVFIDARGSLPVQLDGDYFGTTPVAIQVAPGALRAMVPRGPHPQLRRGQVSGARGQGPGDGETGRSGDPETRGFSAPPLPLGEGWGEGHSLAPGPQHPTHGPWPPSPGGRDAPD